VNRLYFLYFILTLLTSNLLFANVNTTPNLKSVIEQKISTLSLRQKLMLLEQKQTGKTDHFIFDLPVTYNPKVSFWISYFQGRGKKFFRNWLEKASKYMPQIQRDLKSAGLPMDLAYMVMIESGFSATATSSASAVGPWQFIPSTARSYGLHQTYWVDERRDLTKSTQAAIKYLKDLHQEFGSWYLVAASYNMGENGLRKQIKRHQTKDYWELVRRKALPDETQNYVPKILAAMMISKAPNLYGFRNLDPHYPQAKESVFAPAGTDLDLLADHLNVTRKSLKDLNAEIILGYIPKTAVGHEIRIPKGSQALAQEFFREQNKKFDYSQ
jgi:membrane-bound lytic murein transglycosylase D